MSKLVTTSAAWLLLASLSACNTSGVDSSPSSSSSSGAVAAAPSGNSGQTASDSTGVGETSPAIDETLSDVADAAPLESAVDESTALVEETVSGITTDPVVDATTAVVEDPAAALEDSATTIEETTAAVEDTTGSVGDAVPVVEEPATTVEDPAAVVDGTPLEPIADETATATEEAAPEPALTWTCSALAEVGTVVTTSVSGDLCALGDPLTQSGPACSVGTPDAAADADPTTAATVNIDTAPLEGLAAGEAIITVQLDLPGELAAGEQALFDIALDAGLSLLGTLTVETALNGQIQESSANLALSPSAPADELGTRQFYGISTTLPFNRVALTLTVPAGYTGPGETAAVYEFCSAAGANPVPTL